jgi:ATP/maltotriose-dependent transcriptional regulator MalT
MNLALTTIAADLFRQLPQDQRIALQRLCDGETVVKLDAVHDALLCALPSVLRLGKESSGLEFASDALRQACAAALADSPDVHETATAAYRRGRVLEAIETAITDGDHALAIEWFREQGGIFFMHYHGQNACRYVIDLFPEEIRQNSSTLILASSMHALKSGSVNRARHIIRNHFGAEALDVDRVVNDPELYSLEFRSFRLLMGLYEDVAFSERVRQRMFDLLGEFSLDDHLNRGAIYNTMLELCMQQQQFGTAEEIANRAAYHYRLANAHLMVFYIEFHRGVLSLVRGHVPDAEMAIRAADDALSRVAFETPTDHRLLDLLKSVLAYEKGDAERLVTYLGAEFDKFAYGELWPTIVELALYYGSLAISGELGVAAARTFLEKWRVQEWRSQRFHDVITQRQIDILQNHNRWQEAADLLTTVQVRINRTWVESAEEALARIDDSREIAIAIAWLRQLMHQTKPNEFRARQIAAFLNNPNLSGRQRSVLMLWDAYVARARRNLTQARRQFSRVLEESIRSGSMTHLVGERAIIDLLRDDKRISTFVLSTPGASGYLRKLDGFHVVAHRRDMPGLTRQERRVLTLVAEGGSNKFVARQMRLSEVTVKFHLSNIYRKIGCRRRTEAIAAARAMNWVA